jgi:hypothetical protein
MRVIIWKDVKEKVKIKARWRRNKKRKQKAKDIQGTWSKVQKWMKRKGKWEVFTVERNSIGRGGRSVLGVQWICWWVTERVHWAGIFKQSMGARNRIGRGLSYRPARLHRLAELIS